MEHKSKIERMKLLMEYAFIDHNELNEQDPFIDELMMEDGDENDEISFDDMEANAEGGEADPLAGGDDPMGGDDSNTALAGGEPDAMGAEEPATEPAVEPMPAIDGQEPAPEVEAQGDEIELDVTELVDNTEEAKRKADETAKKLDDLSAQIDSILQGSAKIDALAGSIQDLQKEIIKRNPNKVEKLELQSLHSAPYNVKLGEYWEDKVGDYAEDISDSRPTFNDLEGESEMEVPTQAPIQAPQPEEFVVTSDDVASEYNEYQVKNSFSDYEEEDIEDYN